MLKTEKISAFGRQVLAAGRQAGFKATMGYNPLLAKTIGDFYHSPLLGRHIAADYGVVTNITGRLDLRLVEAKYGELPVRLISVLQGYGLIGKKIGSGLFGFSTDLMHPQLAGEGPSGAVLPYKSNLLESLHIVYKGEGRAVSETAAAGPAQGAGGGGGSAGPLLLDPLLEERTRLDIILDADKKIVTDKDKNFEIRKRFIEFYLSSAGIFVKDMVAVRSALKEVADGVHPELAKLAGEALVQIEGRPSVQEKDFKIEKLEAELTNLDAELPAIASSFIESGERAAQEGLLHFLFQYILAEKGEAKDSKVGTPKMIKEAMGLAAKKFARDEKKFKEKSADYKEDNFVKLVVNYINLFSASGATEKHVSPLQLDVFLDTYKDVRASVRTRAAVTRLFCSFFAGRQEAVLSCIKTALGEGNPREAGIALRVAQCLYPALSNSNKKEELKEVIKEYYQNMSQNPNAFETLVFFRLTEMVLPVPVYAESVVKKELRIEDNTGLYQVRKADERIPEPAIEPENENVWKNIDYVEKNHKIGHLGILGMEYYTQAAERTRMSASEEQLKASGFFRKVLEWGRQTFSTLGSVSANTKDVQKGKEISMSGNLAAFIHLVRNAKEILGEKIKEIAAILLTKAGAGTRVGLLGLIEDVDKGTVRLGYATFEEISLTCAAMVSSQFKQRNKESGMIILAGCDQLLLSYADFEAGGIMLTETKALSETRNGLYIFNCRAEVEGTKDKQLEYLNQLGQVLLTEESIRLVFIEKPKLGKLRDGIRRAVLHGKMFSGDEARDYWPQRLKNTDRGERAAKVEPENRALGKMKIEELFKMVCEENLNLGGIDQFVEKNFKRAIDELRLVREEGVQDNELAWLRFFLDAGRSTEKSWEVKYQQLEDAKAANLPELKEWKLIRKLAKGFLFTNINTFIMGGTPEVLIELEDCFENYYSHDPKTGKKTKVKLLDSFKEKDYLDWSQLLMEPMVSGRQETWEKTKEDLEGEIESLEETQRIVQEHAPGILGIGGDIKTFIKNIENSSNGYIDFDKQDGGNLKDELVCLRKLICIRAWIKYKKEKKGYSDQHVHIKDWLELWRIAEHIETKAGGLAALVLDHFSDTGTIDEVFRKYMDIFNKNHHLSAVYRRLQKLQPPPPPEVIARYQEAIRTGQTPNRDYVKAILKSNIEPGARLGDAKDPQKDFKFYRYENGEFAYVEIGGVRIYDPLTAYIGRNVKLKAGTAIHRYVYLLDAELDEQTEIPSYVVINGAKVKGRLILPDVKYETTALRPDQIPARAMRIIYDLYYDGEQELVIPPDKVVGSIELYNGVREVASHSISIEGGKLKDHEFVDGTGLTFGEDGVAGLVQSRPRRCERTIKEVK